MKLLKENHTAISTVLAFALIPLSGFATDVYIPSFPAMANFFGASYPDIQLTLVAFVVSYGISQLFVGSLVDSFGRYRLSLVSLFTFAISSCVIALSHSIVLVLVMRIIQGITIAVIAVSKRAFIMDIYSGEKLKHYTSLVSIVWAIAPILAPFIGGFLQYYFGWQSNFYFLAIVTIMLIALEFLYSGETIKEPHPFNFKRLLNTYTEKLATPDFSISLIILGLCYSLLIMFNMASPFIIEQVFHHSPVATGNSALVSGLAILAGSLLAKWSIRRPMVNKITIACISLLVLPALLIAIMIYNPSLSLMMATIFLIHIASGFIYNTFYPYAVTRFSAHAGIVSGLTGAGTHIITSLVSYIVASMLSVKDPVMLAVGYLTITTMIVASIVVFTFIKRTATADQKVMSDLKIELEHTYQ